MCLLTADKIADKQVTEAKMRAAFNFFDKTHEGFITKEDLVQVGQNTKPDRNQEIERIRD